MPAGPGSKAAHCPAPLAGEWPAESAALTLLPRRPRWGPEGKAQLRGAAQGRGWETSEALKKHDAILGTRLLEPPRTLDMATLTPCFSIEKIKAMNPNAEVIFSSVVKMLFTKLGAEFLTEAEYADIYDRLMFILAEGGLARLPGAAGAPAAGRVCGVEIVGSELETGGLPEALRRAAPDLQTAKILIRRDGETGISKLLYSQLLVDVADLRVVLCDPGPAAGASVRMGVEELRSAGVEEERILLLSVVSCPDALVEFNQRYPGVKIVTLAVDVGDGIPV